MILEPVAPHDGLTFEQLERAYNFRRTSDRRRVFSRMVVERAALVGGEAARVLDIGCGQGIGRNMDFLYAIRSHVAELWGLEPDPTIADEGGAFDRFQNTTMENAELPAGHFDLAYSFMVMEHVENPDAFFAAVRRVLRPGGEYLFITPNGKHYFTRLAAFLNRIGLDELVLRTIRGKRGTDYHYPVRYRCNDPGRIAALAMRNGFEPPRVVYVEPRGPATYLPGPLRPLFWLLALKRLIIRRPEHLISMLVLLRKPA